MSKELEALERIKNITYDRTELYGIEVYRKDLELIETALNDGSYCKYIIDIICKYLGLDMKSHRDLIETKNEILSTLLIQERKIKAFTFLKRYIRVEKLEHENTCYLFFGDEVIQINNETYDLLKEVML